MYAVIRTGGKQYRVAPEDIIEIEKIPGDVGETVEFGEVLMLGGDGTPEVGQPLISGALVAGQVLDQGRDRKIIVFKKKRRKNYRRTKGHRQELTTVRIVEILTGGKKPSKAKAKAATKKAPADKAKDADTVKSKAKGPEAPAKAASQPKAKPAASGKARKFEPLDKAEGKADNLKLITGVGPKLEEKLNGAGIWHFWQIAGFSADDIARIDDELSVKGLIGRDDWAGQARDLMSGKTPETKPAKKAPAAKKPAAKKDS